MLHGPAQSPRRPNHGLLARLSGSCCCVSLYPLSHLVAGVISRMQLSTSPSCCQTERNRPRLDTSCVHLALLAVQMTFPNPAGSSLVEYRRAFSTISTSNHKACNFRPSRSARGSSDMYPFRTHPHLAYANPPPKRESPFLPGVPW